VTGVVAAHLWRFRLLIHRWPGVRELNHVKETFGSVQSVCSHACRLHEVHRSRGTCLSLEPLCQLQLMGVQGDIVVVRQIHRNDIDAVPWVVFGRGTEQAQGLSLSRLRAVFGPKQR
jgi:hypothetical protein